MKKIGFVDYYLSEWHANNYPAWIKEACENAGLDYELAYAWAELDTSILDGVTTDQWCEKFGATKCDTLEELCEKSDVIVILSPSFPEKHLPYAEVVLKYGKRTYIDKTFAPDYATALKIFELGEKYNAPFFSSSALRYATELNDVKVVANMVTTGGGRTLDEYGVHQCEMIIKKLGMGVKSVVADIQGTQVVAKIAFESGKSATLIYGVNFPFTVYMESGEGPADERWARVSSPFFKGLIADMVNFFDTGDISFDVNETKEVIKLVEMVLKARDNPGVVIEA